MFENIHQGCHKINSCMRKMMSEAERDALLVEYKDRIIKWEKNDFKRKQQ